jgi:hypothetical protein
MQAIGGGKMDEYIAIEAKLVALKDKGEEFPKKCMTNTTLGSRLPNRK